MYVCMYVCIYVFVVVAAGPFTKGGRLLYWPHDEGECLYVDNLPLEDAVTLHLQGGAAVFNGKCAHAAEPSTNERCSVIGFTCVVGPERPREGSTHTHTHPRTGSQWQQRLPLMKFRGFHQATCPSHMVM